MAAVGRGRREVTEVRLVGVPVVRITRESRSPLWRETGWPAARPKPAPARPARRIAPLRLVMSLVAVAILAVAGWVAVTAALVPTTSGFTQLWVVPSSEGIQIGVANYERSTETYRIAVQANGQEIAAWEPVRLDNRQTWRVTATVPADAAPATVTLSRLSNPGTVYRTVTYWPPTAPLPAPPPPPPAAPPADAAP